MDTGHVKQIAAFEKLLGFCNAQGAMFNPSKGAIQLTVLRSLLVSAQQSLEAVQTARTVCNHAVNVRSDTFSGLPKFMTRMVNALAANGASEATLEEAYRFVRTFYRSSREKRAGARSPSPDGMVKFRSSAQLDFDSKTDNFEGLVKVISLEPSYQPNEAELQVPSLVACATHLHELNAAVLQAQINLSHARSVRNSLLYEATGIHGRALIIKHYVKGVFGFQSVAYNQIRGLKFLTQKIA